MRSASLNPNSNRLVGQEDRSNSSLTTFLLSRARSQGVLDKTAAIATTHRAASSFMLVVAAAETARVGTTQIR